MSAYLVSPPPLQVRFRVGGQGLRVYLDPHDGLVDHFDGFRVNILLTLEVQVGFTLYGREFGHGVRVDCGVDVVAG